MSRLNITIPVFNEEAVLEDNILKLTDFCFKNLNDEWFIVIANNNSTDSSGQISENLANCLPKKIKFINASKKGKGLAIKTGWEKFDADYYIFMDADLATDLRALPELIKELKSGNDIAIGSRRLKGSKTTRSLLRQIVSFFYKIISRFVLNLDFSDLACGFKGITQNTQRQIIPNIKNQEWFFDTEMLYLANQNGLKIKEIPIQWTETPNKRRKNGLNIFSVSFKYLKAILILRITGR